MKTTVKWMCAAIVLAGLGSAGSASAQSRFGLGLSQSLVGAGGPSVNIWVSDKLIVVVPLSFSLVSPSGGSSQFGLVIAPGAFYSIANSDVTHFGIGGQLSFGMRTGQRSTASAAETTHIGLAITIGARIEHFFSPNFAINGGVGLTIQIPMKDSGPGSPYAGNAGSDTFVLAFGPNAGAVGNMGATYYF